MLSRTLCLIIPNQELETMLAPDHDFAKSKQKFCQLIENEIYETTGLELISVKFTDTEHLEVTFGRDLAPPNICDITMRIYNTTLIKGNWKSYNGDDFPSAV
jgi:hypothetical protein